MAPGWRRGVKIPEPSLKGEVALHAGKGSREGRIGWTRRMHQIRIRDPNSVSLPGACVYAMFLSVVALTWGW